MRDLKASLTVSLLLRDHFILLIKNKTRVRNIENRQSGIDVPYKEINVLLDEIIEDMEGCAAELAEETESKKS